MTPCCRMLNYSSLWRHLNPNRWSSHQDVQSVGADPVALDATIVCHNIMLSHQCLKTWMKAAEWTESEERSIYWWSLVSRDDRRFWSQVSCRWNRWGWKYMKVIWLKDGQYYHCPAKIHQSASDQRPCETLSLSWEGPGRKWGNADFIAGLSLWSVTVMKTGGNYGEIIT